MNLCIGILENDKTCIKQITDQINKWGDDKNHTLEIQTFQTAKELKKKFRDYNSFHFFILDIMLTDNGETGLDVAKHLRNNRFKNDIVFLTSFREYVFEGYNVNAFNFLLKPLQEEKLTPVLDALASKYSGQFYTFRNGATIRNIPYNDILSFSSNNHETNIMTNEATYVEHSTLNSIISHLPAYFIQCHRSCIVNICHVKKIQNNSVYLSNNTTQTIGRKYIGAIKDLYMKYITGGTY